MAHPWAKARHDCNQQETRRENKPGFHQRDRVLMAEQKRYIPFVQLLVVVVLNSRIGFPDVPEAAE